MNPVNAPAHIHLVDDDGAVRRALGLLLRTLGYRVSEHPDAASLLGAVHAHEHACIVLDIRLVGASGLAVPALLDARGVRLPIVFISGHADVPCTAQAFKLGAVDLLQKPIHEQSLIDAVERALAQDAAAKADARVKAQTRERLARLSAREREVLQGIAQGRTNRELADAWGVSVRTVESQRASLFDKLEVRHVIELATYAGLLTETASKA
jgi:two-component system, LuxR family, response regulator FixJ